ncbi:MAG: sialidase family protein [Longimicrobiaceae bacterium]
MSLATSPGRQAAFATYQDIEPALMTQVRAGVEHQVAVWMEFTNGLAGGSQFASSHFANGNGRANYLGKLPGYTGRYADPWLAQNTSSAAPLQRIYLVGIIAGGSTADPNALVRWYSDNGGYSWSAPGLISGDSTSPAAFFRDKPAVAVSAAAGSAGYVYVAYIRRNRLTNRNELVVQASTDAGATWKAPTLVTDPATTSHQAPQVMVDSNGDVYVLWTRWLAGTDELRIARSPAYSPSTGSMTFTQGLPANVGNLYGGAETFACGAGCAVRAASIPIARLDAARRRIAVAWHRPNGTGGSVIDFGTVGVPGMGWGPRITLPWNGGNDVQPSMDFDASGNYLVSFYAFGLNVPTYYNVARYVVLGGSTPVVEDAGQPVHTLSGAVSDVSQYPADVNGMRLLGEYHDVSFSNGTFKTVGIQIVGYGNPYVFTTTHN